MKLTQLLKYTSLMAIAAFTFACGSDSDPAPAPSVSVTSITPSPTTIGSTVTVVGTALDGLDSAKIGAAKLTIASNTSTQFTFVVPVQAFSGKLYVYNNGKVDSTKSIVITEPSGRPTSSTISYLVDGKPYEFAVLTRNDTLGTTPVLVFTANSQTNSVVLFTPNTIPLNTPIPSGQVYGAGFLPDRNNLDNLFIANGINGATGATTFSELVTSSHLRGTFSFIAINDAGKKVNVTNGRFAVRIQ